MKDHLLQMFAYDRWANELWFDDFNKREVSEAELGQMAHILGSQQIWLARIGGTSPKTFDLPEPTREVLETTNRAWLEALESCNPEEVISYTRTTGEAHELSIEQIALHVANHGTYHRGVLRGIALSKVRTDFPDTDLVGYFLL